MNSNGSIVQTPFHSAHSHFYDYITDFPGLPIGDSHEESHNKIMKKLRNQLVNKVPYPMVACLRSCFKLQQKKYVEFCLEKKCENMEFTKAAEILGYLKKDEKDKTKAEHSPESHKDH